MANYWNHHSKRGALETLQRIVMSKSSGIGEVLQDKFKGQEIESIKIPALEACGVRIKIRATPCNYGGFRFWFVCGGCNRNRLVLRHVESQNKFFCNGCLNGVHRITQMSKSDRRYNRRAGIREKLGLDRQHGLDELRTWHKPKGMHWKTFKPLMRKHNELIEIDSQMWMASCRRLFPTMFKEF